MKTGERVEAKYLFGSWRQTGEIKGKKCVVHATVPGKKQKKVREQMQVGMTGVWEGHLLQVQASNETNRKALFFCSEA